jgi:hypothetical protein
MKRIVLFLALFSILFSCVSPKPVNTEELKKSAETFVLNWFKSFEIKKWAEPNNLFIEGAQFYTPTRTTVLNDEFKSMIDFYTNEVLECKVDVISMSTEVLGSDAALVTVRYLEADKLKDVIMHFEYLDNYLLEKQNGALKMKRLVTEFSHPVTFSNAVDIKWQNAKAEPFYRFNGVLGQMAGMSLYFIENYKTKGISPGKLGKEIGARFAKSWDQSKGFQGLASGFVWLVQTASPNIEILERTDRNVKIRYENVFRNDKKSWNLTDEEILDYFKNAFGAIADHMGGTCSIERDGNFYILTLNSK